MPPPRVEKHGLASLDHPSQSLKPPGRTAWLLGSLLILVGAAFGATQHVARQLSFDPRLGGRLALPDALEALHPVLWGGLLVLALSAAVDAVKASGARQAAMTRAAAGLGYTTALVYLTVAPYAYPPYAFFRWITWLSDQPLVQPILREGLIVLAVLAALGAVALVVVIGPSPSPEASGTFGTARFGDGKWFKGATERPGQGVPVGYRDGEAPLLYDSSGVHAFICAPTGAGKTVGFAIPTLLSHRGSAFILDVKGELHAVTARHRNSRLRQRVRRIDPFGEGTSDAFNPLDIVVTQYDLDEHATEQDAVEQGFAFDNAKMISEMLVVKTGNENEPFFVDNGRQLMTGLLLYVASEHRRMREVRVPDFEAYHRQQRERAAAQQPAMPNYLALYELAELVRGAKGNRTSGAGGDGAGAGTGDGAATSAPAFGGGPTAPEECPWFPGMPYKTVRVPNLQRSLVEVRRLLMLPDVGLRELLTAMCEHDHPVVQKRGAQFARMDERTFSSVVATARSHSEFLDSPAIQRTLQRSTFDFRELKEDPTTVFLIMPVERLDNYSRFVRVLVGCAQARLLAIRHRPRFPVLFLLDEFPRLQKFEKIDEGLSAHRGFGLQYLIVVQSVAQLEDIYGKLWRNFITNTGLQVLWAPNDDQACKFISDAAGDRTVAYVEQSENLGQQGRHVLADSYSSGTSRTLRETKRKLIEPDEARTLDDTYCFVFTRGKAPVVLRRPNYLTDPIFKDTFDPNPYHEDVKRTPKVSDVGRAFAAASHAAYQDPKSARRLLLQACLVRGIKATRQEARQRPGRFGKLRGHPVAARRARRKAQENAAKAADLAAVYCRMEGEERIRELLGVAPARDRQPVRQTFEAASEALCAYPAAARIQFIDRCTATNPAAARDAFIADPSWVGPLRSGLDEAERVRLVEQFASAGARYATLRGTSSASEVLVP